MEDPTTPWLVADVMSSAQRPLMALSVAAFGVIAVTVGALLFGSSDQPVRAEGAGEISSAHSAP
ncbi:hypothetical protein [Mycolicibacterium confluentis]|nr:hypothetical protein [Mycolicibacterium confluentis]MCV7320774.1 hypothetical protein [Mycolicibacterium confluentis]